MSRQRSGLLAFDMEPTGFSASFSDEDMAGPRASKLASDFISSKYKTLYDIAFRDAESWFSSSFAPPRRRIRHDRGLPPDRRKEALSQTASR